MEHDSVKLERLINGLRKIAGDFKPFRQLGAEEARKYRRIARETLIEIGLDDDRW